jgi:hypothetical protein
MPWELVRGGIAFGEAKGDMAEASFDMMGAPGDDV